MKFANLLCDGKMFNVVSDYLDKEYNNRSINLGDYIQVLSIENLYRYMGIEEDEIVRISMTEIKNYDGEKIILPFNLIIDSHYFFDEDGLAISKKIIPIFLGITFNNFNFSKKTLQYLKTYEPIGCRDEKTMRELQTHGIKSYLNGCMTLTLGHKNEKRVIHKKRKVFFIDAPESLKEHVPDNLKENAIFLENEYYSNLENLLGKKTLTDFIEEHYEKIILEASLVVTSRFHVAVPCLAWKIPVILAKDFIDHRFAWLDKFIPLYDLNDFDKINWNPSCIDIDWIKVAMLENAKIRILAEYNRYTNMNRINEFFIHRDIMHEYIYESPSDFSQIDEFLDKDRECKYAIWGVSMVAEELYKYISENYPKACLVAVFDSYRKIVFHGIKTVLPENICNNFDYITFITSRRVCGIAEEFFGNFAKRKNAFCLVAKKTDKIRTSYITSFDK